MSQDGGQGLGFTGGQAAPQLGGEMAGLFLLVGSLQEHLLSEAVVWLLPITTRGPFPADLCKTVFTPSARGYHYRDTTLTVPWLKFGSYLINVYDLLPTLNYRKIENIMVATELQ